MHSAFISSLLSGIATGDSAQNRMHGLLWNLLRIWAQHFYKLSTTICPGLDAYCCWQLSQLEFGDGNKKIFPGCLPLHLRGSHKSCKRLNKNSVIQHLLFSLVCLLVCVNIYIYINWLEIETFHIFYLQSISFILTFCFCMACLDFDCVSVSSYTPYAWYVHTFH